MLKKFAVGVSLGIATGWVAITAASAVLAAPAAETYRLVQALGNTEHISAKGLSKPECEARKRELKIVATALGTYDEATGFGSITCLPESYFEDGK